MTEALMGNTPEASDSDPVFTKQQRIAQLAQQNSTMGFTSLNHHLDLEWLIRAYVLTRKDGAAGVDGQTAEQYAEHLRENLRDLLERAKSGRYVAPPVRRVYIPKGTGGDLRPLGIPTFEDKILQRAVLMLLEPIYEEDFLDCSFGFRPGRSAHQALEALRSQLLSLRGGWVLDVDIRKFFDTLDHARLRELLRQRIHDGVVLRLLGKWLHAGVLEEGRLTHPDAGTPQGGVISPLLANLFLHYVLDEWYEQDVKPRLKGRSFLIRYADDFVLACECEDDARRVLEVLPKRFARFGLTLHPDKTRLVRFERPPHAGKPLRADRPGTFDFLGLTHYWGRSRRGNWVVQQKTAATRFQRALKKIAGWCRLHRHEPIPEQHRMLSQQLRGHDAYYGVTGNSRCLSTFHRRVTRLWHKWLSRRSWASYLSWDRFTRMLERLPLPPPRVVHSVYRRVATVV
jgi:group II intron reverse transcriptase/maturase